MDCLVSVIAFLEKNLMLFKSVTSQEVCPSPKCQASNLQQSFHFVQLPYSLNTTGNIVQNDSLNQNVIERLLMLHHMKTPHPNKVSQDPSRGLFGDTWYCALHALQDCTQRKKNIKVIPGKHKLSVQLESQVSEACLVLVQNHREAQAEMETDNETYCT